MSAEISNSVALSDVPRVHPEAAVARVGGRWVAATLDDRSHSFEEADGSVSEVGERIVELIDGRRSMAQIVEVVLSEFEVTREVAEHDTLRFVALLIRKHVVTL